MQVDEQLASNIQTLLDIEAIKKLKAQYCKYADNDCTEQFLELFTEDAVLDEGDDGVFVGKSEIEQMCQKIKPYIELNQHLVISPIIDVDGDNATGHWRLLQLMSVNSDSVDGEAQAYWAAGYYQEQYVKIDGQWKFKHIEARIYFCCAYEQGWAGTPFADVLSDSVKKELGII